MKFLVVTPPSIYHALCVGYSRTLLRESVLKLSSFDRVNDEEDDGTQWREVPKNKISSCEDS